MKIEKCRVARCDRDAQAKELCGAHYLRVKRGKPVGPPLRLPPSPGFLCSIEDCGRPGKAQSLCSGHYARARQGRPLDSPLKQMGKRGAGFIDSHGYRVKKVAGRRAPEHHLVMERVLGRQLKPFENVHHKNGRRADNHPSNLELWTKPQPPGQRPEDLARWVVEHYVDLVETELKARTRERRTGQLRLIASA